MMYCSWVDSRALALAASVSYFLAFWARLGPEERRVVGVLAVDQRDEAQVGQLLFAAVGDGDLGRALQRDFALVGLERVGRQALDQAAALDPADRRAPAVLGERSVSRAPKA